MPDVYGVSLADQNRSLPESLPQNRVLTLIRWWGLDGVPNTPAIPTNSASHLSPPGFHADHVGQVTSFPKATLLIGKGLLQQAAAACAEAMPLRLLRLHNTCDARTCNAYYRLLMSGVLRQCEACGAFWGRPQEEETFSSYGQWKKFGGIGP